MDEGHPEPDAVWHEFRRTCVQIFVAGGVLDVIPTISDPTNDPELGPFLPGAHGPIHIVTAQNPMGLAASPEDNEAAHSALAVALDALGGLRVWPATGYGGGPIDEVGTWQEAGFAVEGFTRPEAIDLAGHYRQRAIFEWQNEPGGFRLVACDGSADEPRNWVATLTPK